MSPSAEQAPAAGTAIVVEVRGPLAPDQVRQLCDRIRELLLARDARTVVCDVPGVIDLGVLDVLARLQLTARRLGGRLSVHTPDDDLQALLTLTGLAQALPGPLQTCGQAEPCEQAGVEEVVDVHDLPG